MIAGGDGVFCSVGASGIQIPKGNPPSGDKVRMDKKKEVGRELCALRQEAMLRIYGFLFLFGEFCVSSEGSGGIVPVFFVAEVNHVDKETGGDVSDMGERGKRGNQGIITVGPGPYPSSWIGTGEVVDRSAGVGVGVGVGVAAVVVVGGGLVVEDDYLGGWGGAAVVGLIGNAGGAGGAVAAGSVVDLVGKEAEDEEGGAGLGGRIVCGDGGG